MLFTWSLRVWGFCLGRNARVAPARLSFSTLFPIFIVPPSSWTRPSQTALLDSSKTIEVYYEDLSRAQTANRLDEKAFVSRNERHGRVKSNQRIHALLFRLFRWGNFYLSVARLLWVVRNLRVERNIGAMTCENKARGPSSAYTWNVPLKNVSKVEPGIVEIREAEWSRNSRCTKGPVGSTNALEGGRWSAGREINWRQDGIKASQEAKHLLVGCSKLVPWCTRPITTHINCIPRNVHLAPFFYKQLRPTPSNSNSSWIEHFRLTRRVAGLFPITISMNRISHSC